MPSPSYGFMLIDPTVSGKSACGRQSDSKPISLNNFMRVFAVHIQLKLQSSTACY